MFRWLVISLFFMSCVANQNDNDSAIKIDPTEKRRMIDSLKMKLQHDSTRFLQSKIAFGKVLFGMTEKEFYKLDLPFSEVIGSARYYHSALFDGNGRLYMFNLVGGYENANYLDNTIKNQVDNLVSTISEKYDLPDVTYPYPSILQFGPGGNILLVAKWTIFTKKIEIGVQEKQSGSEYQAICMIYDVDLWEAQRKINRIFEDSVRKSSSNKF